MNAGDSCSHTGWSPWQVPVEVGAEEFVAAAEYLLCVAVDATASPRLPREVIRDALVAGLEASLSTDGPLAVLRLDPRTHGGEGRSALRENAQAAGLLVMSLVRAAGGGPDVAGDPGFVSHCVGYVWTDAVASLLTGSSGTHMARNHYNEWLWQLVALRDALIPFARPDAVRLTVDTDGLRRTETARDRFAFELSSRRIASATLFAHVAAVLGAPSPVPEGAYGVSVRGATVLPACLTRVEVGASPWLYDVTTGVPPGMSGTVQEGGFVVENAGLSIDLSDGSRHWRIDAGAVVTGHRRALRPAAGPPATEPYRVARWEEILSVNGQFRAEQESLVVATGGRQPLVSALLGKVDAGHAVLWRGEDIAGLAPATERDGQGLVLIDLRP